MLFRFALPAAVLLGVVASASAVKADSPLLFPQTPIVIPGGPGGFDYMQLDGDMYRVMASHPGKTTLVVYDWDKKEVKQLDTDGEVNGIAVDKADNKLFAGGHGGKVDVFDRTTLAKIDTITIGGPGDDIVLDKTSDTLWVCHDDGTEDWVIDAKTDKVLGTAAGKAKRKSM